MKKLLKLFLMLTFSLLFLVACGEKGKEEAKSENTQKKTLTISWHQDIGFLIILILLRLCLSIF